MLWCIGVFIGGMMRYKNFWLLLLLFTVLFRFSSAQQLSVTVEKKEGRYISGRLDVHNYSILNEDRTGLIKEIHLNIELWTLLGEPMEKYLFRWVKGSKVMASDYTYLSEEVLRKYPDLLRRYNDLRPNYMELEYNASTVLDPKYKNIENLEICGEKFINNLQLTKEATWGSNNGASGSRVINSYAHFFITKAGVVGDEIVPSSPRDWLHFIQWSYPPSYSNKAAKNTFKYSNSMTFSGLVIHKLKLPMREIDAIAKEFNKRERKQEEKENTEEEDSEEEIPEEEQEDDFWDDSSLTEAGGAEIAADDFWEKDRISVEVSEPAENESFDSNVIDFSASFNIQDEGYEGYLEYNGVNQRLQPTNGRFNGKIVLKSGRNNILFSIKNASNIVYSKRINVVYTGEPVKLRATLTWDGQADIDLYLDDANNATCSYNHKNTSLASLDVDNTTAYGPENISVESITSGSYKVYIHNYSGTAGITATVYLYVNEELESVTNHTFSGENSFFTIKTLTF